MRAVATVLLLVLVGCGGQPVERESAEVVDPGPLHVHGLGVDPGSGDLYVATHTGLFRVDGAGRSTRVADRSQDTMGFAVVGPGHFLGSGHPDPREHPDLDPPHLGLIESTDAGETWRSLSLRAVADFHVLHRAHGRTYGYDSTSRTLMVSRDGLAWERRSTLPLLDVEVDPADPDRLVASGATGLLLSSDGGRTWSPLRAAPPAPVLSWAASGRLYGVTAQGAVVVSGDAGRTWERRATGLGEPEAVVAGPGADEIHVAVAGGVVLRSEDGGRGFTTRLAAAG